MPGEFMKRELNDNTYTVTHTVDNSRNGMRADVFLKTCLKSKSRAYIQKAIDNGTIELAGRVLGQTPRLKPSTVLQTGDEIKILWERGKPEPMVDFNYKVLLEDDDILVIDKPGNLPVHPAGRFFFNTLLTQLRTDRAEDFKQGRDFYLVHRIDRETSGVLLIAKKSIMARKLVAQFYDHEVSKKYYAVVQGHAPEPEFTVDKNMTNDAGAHVRLKMTTCGPGEGMTALTHFKLKERGQRFDLLEAFPKTGRQHQIRVHLASIGLPLVGDKLYGGYERHFLGFLYDGIFTDEMEKHLHSKRHALHAGFLSFRHPATQKKIEIESELPADLRALLDA